MNYNNNKIIGIFDINHIFVNFLLKSNNFEIKVSIRQRYCFAEFCFHFDPPHSEKEKFSSRRVNFIYPRFLLKYLVPRNFLVR